MDSILDKHSFLSGGGPVKLRSNVQSIVGRNAALAAEQMQQTADASGYQRSI